MAIRLINERPRPSHFSIANKANASTKTITRGSQSSALRSREVIEPHNPQSTQPRAESRKLAFPIASTMRSISSRVKRWGEEAAEGSEGAEGAGGCALLSAHK